MPECGLFLGLTTNIDTSHYYSCGIFARLCKVHYAYALSSSALIHTCQLWKWTGCYRKWRDGHRACSLSAGCHYSVYEGNDALLKRRWNLNAYLKYIQKEVTVSLSCAGFYNSPFSISHVRKMFLLLVTAQRTIFLYYSITSMQINHRNVYT